MGEVNSEVNTIHPEEKVKVVIRAAI